LSGCQTWGDTYEAAVRNAEEALAVYIDTLIANGDPIPEAKMSAGPTAGSSCGPTWRLDAMSERLPSVSAKDVVRVLQRAGFQSQRQKGSHVTLRNPESIRELVRRNSK